MGQKNNSQSLPTLTVSLQTIENSLYSKKMPLQHHHLLPGRATPLLQHPSALLLAAGRQ
jgi:hypothetical protein